MLRSHYDEMTATQERNWAREEELTRLALENKLSLADLSPVELEEFKSYLASADASEYLSEWKPFWEDSSEVICLDIAEVPEKQTKTQIEEEPSQMEKEFSREVLQKKYKTVPELGSLVKKAPHVSMNYYVLLTM